MSIDALEGLNAGEHGNTIELMIQDDPMCQLADPGDGNGMNIAPYTDYTVRVQDPDGTALDKDAELTTDGSDGQFEFEFSEGELTEGEHKIQLIAETASIVTKSRVEEFYVLQSL